MSENRIDENCLFRHQLCKRVLNKTRTCFIACPNSDEIVFELKIIKQKLKDNKIKPYIAVDEREYQKDIFCEKICSKIIESMFCIVILNDVTNKNGNVLKPNANVYFEYGLMTALRKYIIPIQKEEQKLAFNIQSLDTLKYNSKNFPDEISNAIKSMLLKIEVTKQKRNLKSKNRKLEWILDEMGYVKINASFRKKHGKIIDSESLDFEPFISSRDDELYFIGIFSDEDDNEDIIMKSKILSQRVRNYCDHLVIGIEEIENKLRNKVNAYGQPLRNDKLDSANSEFSLLYDSSIFIIKENANIELLTKKFNESINDEQYRLNFIIINKDKIKELTT